MALVINTVSLPPDLVYVLDGAADVGEILGCHHAALTLYGKAARIDDIFNNPDHPDVPGYRRSRRRLGSLGLVRYANSIIAEMDDADRDAMGSFAYAHARVLLDEYASFLASWNFEDEIRGGCALPFRRRLRGSADGTPSPRAARRLRSPRAIRRYVKLYDDLDWLSAVITETLDTVPVPRSLMAGEAFNRRMADHIRSSREAEFRSMACVKAPEARRVRHKRRGVVKRAAVMAAAVLGASTVSAFARGEPVTLPGQEVSFLISAPRSLGTLDHSGLRISLLDKDGTRLTGLCVYHEGTPALDQLTAFALRIAAGEEAEIVQAANLYGVEAGAEAHPLLASRAKPVTLDLGVEVDEVDVLGPAFGHDAAFRTAVAAYAKVKAPFYREAVAQRIAGRRADLLLRRWPA